MVFSVAIDGPSGAGKSSLSEALADRLALIHLDTGAMYRSLGLQALRMGLDPSSESDAAQVLELADFQVDFEGKKQINRLRGEAVNSLIRTDEVGMAGSQIARHACVRESMLQAQRRLAENVPMIIDGRDIGTYVLPNAACKIYLDASPEIRAKRRQKQLEENGNRCDYDTIYADILRRDRQDSSRAIAPLKRAEDAIYVDTSTLSYLETLDQLEAIILDKKAEFERGE
ncbi:MAG: (d)CMP kinase [Eubacteriales bacterium]|nr:(d)CMP kinase [Eubacteriales bacterium]